MKIKYNLSEMIITLLIKGSGYSAIMFVGMIFIFLVGEGLPAILEVPLGNLLSTRWYPIEDYFGIVPLFGGSLIVTVGAAIFAIPIGIGTAIFISEIGRAHV